MYKAGMLTSRPYRARPLTDKQKSEKDRKAEDKKNAVRLYQHDAKHIQELSEVYLANLHRLTKVVDGWKSKGFESHGIPVKAFQLEMNRAYAAVNRLLTKAKRAKALHPVAESTESPAARTSGQEPDRR